MCSARLSAATKLSFGVAIPSLLVATNLSTSLATNGVIYFGSDGALYRVDTDGHNLVNLLGGVILSCTYGAVAYDVGPAMVYVTDRCLPEGSSTLWREQPEGSIYGVLRHVQYDSVFAGVAIDPGRGKVYWALRTAGANFPADAGLIQRADLDGSGVETVTTSAGARLGGLREDPIAGKVYWTTFQPDLATSGAIRRVGSDGQNREDLVTGLDEPRDVALDIGGSKFYWTDSGTGKIQRADLADGGNVQDLVSGLGFVYGIDLDPASGKIYWTAGDRIQRANLDGSNVEDVLTEFPGITGLDVVTQTPANVRTLAASGFTVQVLPNGGGSAGSTLVLRLPMDGFVSVDLFTVAGERLVRLLDAPLSAGVWRVSWPGLDRNGQPVARGVYLYQARLGDTFRAGKLFLLR